MRAFTHHVDLPPHADHEYPANYKMNIFGIRFHRSGRMLFSGFFLAQKLRRRFTHPCIPYILQRARRLRGEALSIRHGCVHLRVMRHC